MIFFLCALLGILLLLASDLTRGDSLPEIEGLTWQEVTLPSSLAECPQPVLVGVPESYAPGRETPLLVGIHTWSAGYRQYAPLLGPACARRGWLLALPHFRGPNLTTNPAPLEAGGSLPAQHDVLEAVHHVQAHHNVDPQRILLTGGSGGGHMALLLAGKYPHVWAGVSAWCPITSLREWHAQGNSYAPHIEAVCGGAPGDSPEVDFEYLRRSPRTFITNLAATPVFIGHGDKDATILVEQTFKTYDLLRRHPHCAELYSWHGGHEMLVERALEWLAGQTRPPAAPRELRIVSDEGKWYHWLYVEPAGPLALGRVEATVTDDDPPGLRLQVERCAEVQVQLAAVGLPGTAAVEAVNRPLQPGEAVVVKDVLKLRPARPEPSTYHLSC